MAPMTVMVCPHDVTNRPERWYQFIQFLTPLLAIDLHLELALDFTDFHQGMAAADLVYANPSDSLQLMDRHGFIPVARPAEGFDEAVFVAPAAAQAPALSALDHQVVASVARLLPTSIALRALRAQGITPASIQACESWLEVIRCVSQGSSPYGIVYADFYDTLSEGGKALVSVIARTQERVAFHSVLVSPRLEPRSSAIAAILHGMGESEDGRALLRDLAIRAWVPVEHDALSVLREVAQP